MGVKDIGFLYDNIEKPLKQILNEREYNLKEYWFNLRILSKKFQNFYPDECKINKKSKRFVYTYELDTKYFNRISDEDCLKLVCTEMKISLDKYDEIKPKSYGKDDFREDVLSIIQKWLD
jgi:hypothetical protein